MNKLIIGLILSISIAMANDYFHNYELLSKVDNQNSEFKKESEYKNDKKLIWQKKITTDFFTALMLETDVNNTIYKITLGKTSQDSLIYFAKDLLKRLELKYPKFECKKLTIPDIGEYGFECISKLEDRNIKLRVHDQFSYVTWSGLYLSHISNEIKKIEK